MCIVKTSFSLPPLLILLPPSHSLISPLLVCYGFVQMRLLLFWWSGKQSMKSQFHGKHWRGSKIHYESRGGVLGKEMDWTNRPSPSSSSGNCVCTWLMSFYTMQKKKGGGIFSFWDQQLKEMKSKVCILQPAGICSQGCIQWNEWKSLEFYKVWLRFWENI